MSAAEQLTVEAELETFDPDEKITWRCTVCPEGGVATFDELFFGAVSRHTERHATGIFDPVPQLEIVATP